MLLLTFCLSAAIVALEAESVVPLTQSSCPAGLPLQISTLVFTPSAFPTDTCVVQVDLTVSNAESEALAFQAVQFFGFSDAGNVSSSPIYVGSQEVQPSDERNVTFQVRIHLQDWEGTAEFAVGLLTEGKERLACRATQVTVSPDDNGKCSRAASIALALLWYLG